MRKKITIVLITIMAIMIVALAGCNTSCNKKPTASLVPSETETFIGKVVETSEINGSKVAIIETEIDGVKVTETSIVTSDTEVKIGDTVNVTTTVTTAPENSTENNTSANNTSNNTSGTTTIPTNGNPTADPTTTTTTAAPTTTTTTQTTVVTPTPKPNNTSGDINFGNDESAASSYGDQHNTTVETTVAPTNTPVPTATSTPKPTATPTPEPTATPTPEPTATPTPKPTEPEPQTEYKTITVNWNATDGDGNTYTGSISGVGVHRDPGGSWKWDNKSDVVASVEAAIDAAIPGGFDNCARYSYSKPK